MFCSWHTHFIYFERIKLRAQIYFSFKLDSFYRILKFLCVCFEFWFLVLRAWSKREIIWWVSWVFLRDFIRPAIETHRETHQRFSCCINLIMSACGFCHIDNDKEFPLSNYYCIRRGCLAPYHYICLFDQIDKPYCICKTCDTQITTNDWNTNFKSVIELYQRKVDEFDQQMNSANTKPKCWIFSYLRAVFEFKLSQIKPYVRSFSYCPER